MKDRSDDRGPASAGALTGINLIGTRAVNSPAGLSNEYVPEVSGATDRLLTPGSSEALCLRVRLPSNAKSDIQGGSSSFSLRFVAVQAAGLVP